ncbi:MAG: hypothetical protein ACOC2H_09210 [Spirochaetota bacterium]
MHRVIEYGLLPFKILLHVAVGAVHFLYEFFMSLSLWNRLILGMSFIGIAAVLLPVATFDILGIEYQVNNPLSIHVIVLVMLFDLSVFVTGFWVFAVRMSITLYYCLHFLILFATGNVTSAEPVGLALGFAVNILMILMYMALSGLHYYYADR